MSECTKIDSGKKYQILQCLLFIYFILSNRTYFYNFQKKELYNSERAVNVLVYIVEKFFQNHVIVLYYFGEYSEAIIFLSLWPRKKSVFEDIQTSILLTICFFMCVCLTCPTLFTRKIKKYLKKLGISFHFNIIKDGV